MNAKMEDCREDVPAFGELHWTCYDVHFDAQDYMCVEDALRRSLSALSETYRGRCVALSEVEKTLNCFILGAFFLVHHFHFLQYSLLYHS